jgi:hypothetical protein
MTRAAIRDDRPALIESLVGVGFLKDASNPAANELLCDIVGIFLEPFRHDREFAFGVADLHARATDIPRRFMALGKMQFPPDALYLNRVFVGIYFLLRKLEARGNWHRLILRYAEPS